MSPQDKLKEMRERCEAATPGPWRAGGDEGWPIGSFSTGNSGIDNKDYTIWTAPMSGSELGESDAKTDAEFIASSRSDIPALISALEVCLEALSKIAFCEIMVNDIEDKTFKDAFINMADHSAKAAIAKAEAILS